MWIMVICFVMCCGILLGESICDIKWKKVHVLGAVIIGICGILQIMCQQSNTAGSVLMQGWFCQDYRDLLYGAGIGVFFLAISLLTEGKMGKGDSLYLIALGMLLGFQKMMLLSTIALLVSAFAGIVLLISRKGTKQTKLPFLPFLSASFLLIWVF